jgi:hypothetical protein
VPTPVPVATIPPTGGGGLYFYSSARAGRLVHTTLARSAALSPSTLPTTGGGSGNNPMSPLLPLTLLAAVAIGAGRFVPRLFKR